MLFGRASRLPNGETRGVRLEKETGELIPMVDPGRHPLHALVNNAAISPKLGKGGRMGVKDTSLETWQSVFQVNFYACFMLVNGLLDDLKVRF